MEISSLFSNFIVLVCIHKDDIKDMTRKDKENIKFRILKLAALRSTGRPVDLASRLEISVRSVKRFVGEIRKEGNEIRYSQLAGSYVTEK